MPSRSAEHQDDCADPGQRGDAWLPEAISASTSRVASAFNPIRSTIARLTSPPSTVEPTAKSGKTEITASAAKANELLRKSTVDRRPQNLPGALLVEPLHSCLKLAWLPPATGLNRHPTEWKRTPCSSSSSNPDEWPDYDDDRSGVRRDTDSARRAARGDRGPARLGPWSTFDPAALKARLDELEQELAQPDFWSDQQRAARLSAEHQRTPGEAPALRRARRERRVPA